MDPEGAHLVLIGCGAMGGALLKGWITSKRLAISRFSVVTPRKESVERFVSDSRVEFFPSYEAFNAEDPRPVDILVYAAKPPKVDSILPPYGDVCTPQTLFVSVAAGTPLSRYRTLLGADVHLVRAMPNTPAAMEAGVSLLVESEGIPSTLKERATQLMAAVGAAHWMDSEEDFDRATLLSGCGPAYFFAFMEALQKAGESLGLPAALAETLARETLCGAAQYLQATGRRARDLRREVTSPGGVTQAVLEALSNHPPSLEDKFQKALAHGYQKILEMRQ